MKSFYLLITFIGSILTTSLSAQVTREEQAVLTPEAAFARLIAGHERFLQGRPTPRDILAAAKASSGGQYPAAVLISCLDSRTSAEFIFDQGPGDLFAGRIARNFVDDVMLGSIEFATKVSRATHRRAGSHGLRSNEGSLRRG